MAAKKKQKPEAKYYVITNKSYGIYVGLIDDPTATSRPTRTVRRRR